MPPAKKKKPAVKKELRVARVCSRCGTTERAPEGALPPGWSFETGGGRIQHTCPACIRANLRAIEGKLPHEYWEF